MIENNKTVENAKPETPPVPSLDMGLGSREQYFRCPGTGTTRLRIVKTKIVVGTAA